MATAPLSSYRHWLNQTPSDGEATMNTQTNTAPVTEEAKLAWIAPTLEVCGTGEAENNFSAGSDGIMSS